MSLDKGILHGKEKRKQYYGDKAIDKSCRNHGSDDWSKANREYSANREDERTRQELNEYNKGEENMNQAHKELKEKLDEMAERRANRLSLKMKKDALQRLEERRFFHEMKDHWDAADFDYGRSLDMQISQIEEDIKKLEEKLGE